MVWRLILNHSSFPSLRRITLIVCGWVTIDLLELLGLFDFDWFGFKLHRGIRFGFWGESSKFNTNRFCIYWAVFGASWIVCPVLTPDLHFLILVNFVLKREILMFVRTHDYRSTESHWVYDGQFVGVYSFLEISDTASEFSFRTAGFLSSSSCSFTFMKKNPWLTFSTLEFDDFQQL